MLEYVDALHRALGIKSTWQFVLLIGLSAGVLATLGFGALAWIVDMRYKNSPEYKAEHQNPKMQAVTPQQAQTVTASQQTSPAPAQNQTRVLKNLTKQEDQGKKTAPSINGSDNFQNTGNITQKVAPCGIAIAGNKNIATVNCAPPSGTELAAFASGTAVQIVRRVGGVSDPIATGFWVNKRGYIATCLHLVRSEYGFSAEVPQPPLLGRILTVVAGTVTTDLVPIAADQEADIAIMHVIGSPFERSMHAFAFAQQLDDKGNPVGKPETSQEQYWIPAIAGDLANAGDEIVKIGFTRQDGLPVAYYKFGHISRMGVDETAKKKSYRVFTSFSDSQSTDCGAPIINNAKTVVGMLHEANGEAVPSQYIVDLLDASH
ncbi:MAG TPA: serine protease [Terriglobales bacterium]|nr:serine protease [Terriglobales bacterium]